MFGNKGLIFTLDLFLFLIIVSMLFLFAVNYKSETNVYNNVLAFKEADIFLNHKQTQQINIKDQYICRDFNVFYLQNNTFENRQVCVNVK